MLRLCFMYILASALFATGIKTLLEVQLHPPSVSATMDRKASIPSSDREPLVVNLVAAFCLAVLIALGTYVR